MTPAEARANLAATLKALPFPVETPVHRRQPPRVTAPCVILTPADPWIDTTDLPYGQAWFRFTAQVIASTGNTDAVVDELDGLVAQVIKSALSAPGDWHLNQVSTPDSIVLNTQSHLSADVELSAPFIL